MIPLIIHQIWFQGINNIKEPYRNCFIDTIKFLNTVNIKWNHIFWDKNKIENFILKNYPNYWNIYNKCDILELRLKTMKNRILTDIEFQDKDNNYLKTIYDLPKQSYLKINLEINGLWDYRTDKIENNKCGLIVYTTKIFVLV
jgi:hypothetical protein